MALTKRSQVFKEVDALNAVIDPETNPYDSKYAARTKLLSYIREVEEEIARERPETQDELRVVLACAKSRLGANFLQTEENSNSEKPLLEALELAKRFLEPVEPPVPAPSISISLQQRKDLALAFIEACNYLSLLYSGWDKHARSLRYLRMAKRIYRAIKRVAASSAEPFDIGSIENLYTHTIFYFTQIYNKLEHNEASARYAESTLCRQLNEQLAYKAKLGAAALEPEESHASALCNADKGPEWAAPGGEDAVSSPKPASASIDRVEWVRNAIRLTDFYVVKRRWQAAVECLTAGDIVLHDMCVETAADSPAIDWRLLSETLQRLLAESALAWARLYSTALRVARDGDFEAPALDETIAEASDPVSAGGEDPFSTAPGAGVVSLPASDRPSHVMRQEGGACLKAKRIAGTGADAIDLEDSDHDGDIGEHLLLHAAGSAVVTVFSAFVKDKLPSISALTYFGPANVQGVSAVKKHATCLPTEVNPRTIVDFATAKPYFMAAQAGLLRALEYFVIDGFVTDHIVCLSYYSKAYKYLSHFETDSKRTFAMHNKRVDLLAGVLSEINPAIYTQQHKELSLELASCCQEMVEIKEERADERAKQEGGRRTRSEQNTINELSERAIAFYAHFLRCYADPRLEKCPIDAINAHQPPLSGATTLDDGSAEAYLTAHFYIARLLARKSAATVELRMEDVKRAIFRFEWVIATAPTLIPHTAPPETFGAELYMCREMVRLLPEKLRLIAAGSDV